MTPTPPAGRRPDAELVGGAPVELPPLDASSGEDRGALSAPSGRQVPMPMAPADTHPPLDAATAAADLVALTDGLRAAEEGIRTAVRLAAEVDASDVCEVVEGMPLDLWLANVCRMIGTDRYTLLEASRTLGSMPGLTGLYMAGGLSWGQLRTISRAVNRAQLTDEQIAWIDGRIAATAAQYDGLDTYSPDELLSAVDRAIGDAAVDLPSRPRAVRKRRPPEYLRVQPELFGAVSFHGRCGPVGAALLTNALNSARTDNGDDDFDCDDDNVPSGPGPPVGCSRRRRSGVARGARAIAIQLVRALHDLSYLPRRGT